MNDRCATTRMTDSEESAIIEGCKRGESAAFDLLVRAYENRVYRFAYGLCPRYDDASDVSADTFVRVFRAIHHFRGNASFSTWLFRIVVNVYLDRRKQERRSQHLSLQDYTNLDNVNLVRQIEDPSPTPDRVAEDHERRDALRDAIASLPDYQRAVLALYHTEGKTYSEIADVLSLPVGTVKSRLNRTRLNLRSRLSGAEMFP